MPLLLDIHTHRLPPVPGTAIVNVPLAGFRPCPDTWYSLGLHPWHLEHGDLDLAALHTLARHPRVLAVGEAGIDKLSPAPLPLQQSLFEDQARLADELGKPLVIHCVRATAEVLASRRRVRPRVPWVVHGFRGKAALAVECLRHGLYLSFGEHYQQEALRAVPPGCLFLETDESTVPVAELCARAARLRGMDGEELEKEVAENTGRTFRFNAF